MIELSAVRFRIHPKFDNDFASLVDMILYANAIPIYQNQVSAATGGQNGLLDPLVRMFLAELQLIVQTGIYKGYTERTENLPFVRGRVNFVENAVVNGSYPTRVLCHYDELTTDVHVNQVLLTALEHVMRCSSLPEQTVYSLRDAHDLFRNVCQPYQLPGWPKFEYDRLNVHYRTAHALAEWLVRHLHAKDVLHAGTTPVYSLLIDMNVLFESFVTRLVETSHRHDGTVVEAQKISRTAITMRNRTYREIRPDLLVHCRGVTTVLDVKYKSYSERKVDNADLYQLAFYAQHFQSIDATAGAHHEYGAVLVYPNPSGGVQETTIEMNQATLPGRVFLRGVSISDVLTYAQHRDHAALRTVARRLIASVDSTSS